MHYTIFLSITEVCKDVLKADIYVLADSSGSIAEIGWNRTKNFVVNLSNWLPLGPETVQVGFGIFSSSFVHKFNVNRYTDQDEFSEVGYLSTTMLRKITLKLFYKLYYL